MAPKIIHTLYLLHGRDFPLPPTHQASYIHLNFKAFESPTPQKFSIPSVGEIWVFSRTRQYDDAIGWKFLWSTHSKYWSNKRSMLFSGYVNFLLTTVIQVVIYRGTVTQKYLILVKTQCGKSGIYVIILRLSSWKPLFIPLSIVLLSNETFPEI